jgi:hypothetical protein
MSSEQLVAYVITWETKPSPDAVSYGGARRVFARDLDQAKEQGLCDLADAMGLPAESISIVDVRRLE